jgi:hypothetical protein
MGGSDEIRKEAKRKKGWCEGKVRFLVAHDGVQLHSRVGS